MTYLVLKFVEIKWEAQENPTQPKEKGEGQLSKISVVANGVNLLAWHGKVVLSENNPKFEITTGKIN